MCKKTSCTQNSSLGFKYKYVVTHKLNSYAILHLLFALQRIIASCFKMKMDNNSPHMRPKSILKVASLSQPWPHGGLVASTHGLVVSKVAM